MCAPVNGGCGQCGRGQCDSLLSHTATAAINIRREDTPSPQHDIETSSSECTHCTCQYSLHVPSLQLIQVPICTTPVCSHTPPDDSAHSSPHTYSNCRLITRTIKLFYVSAIAYLIILCSTIECNITTLLGWCCTWKSSKS